VITGWLSDEDCPACGGPLLETLDRPHRGMVTLACPGCGHTTYRPSPHREPVSCDDGYPNDPDDTEAEWHQS